MTPERLIATFCEAHGVDFQAVTLATGEKWSASDAAIACSAYLDRHGRPVRLPRSSESAFRFRWAGDYSSTHTLRDCLISAARRMQRREHWPKQIPRLNPVTQKMEQADYIDDLVDLAILEDQYWWILRKHGLWHIYMRVQPFVWTRTLCSKYEAIRQRLDDWCGDARYHIRRKLRHV
jgi:hypothetical protein